MRNNFKQILIVFTCTFYTCFAIAQSEPDGKFDEWGKVTMDEMTMKECSFEKNADASPGYRNVPPPEKNAFITNFRSFNFPITEYDADSP